LRRFPLFATVLTLASLEYRIDLRADDYIAMNLHATGRRGSERFPVTLAGSSFLILVFSLKALTAMSWLAAVGVAAIAALAASFTVYTTRSTRLVARLRGHYLNFPFGRLLGEQVILFDDDGIHSKGLHFESFRRWTAVTKAIFTPSYVFIHTIYSVIYILPRRFVATADELRTFLALHIPVLSSGDPALVNERRGSVRAAPPEVANGGETPNVVDALLAELERSGGEDQATAHFARLIRLAKADSATLSRLHRILDAGLRTHLTKEEAAAQGGACSFCLRPRQDVYWLIAGSCAMICDQCAKAAEAYIAEAEISRAPTVTRWWLRLRYSRHLSHFSARTSRGGA